MRLSRSTRNGIEPKQRVLKDPLAAFSSKHFLGAKHDDDDYVIETRMRPASLEATEPLPLEVAELSFTSTHPSLPAFLIYVGIVHSLTEAMVLSTTVRLIQKGWETRAPELSDVQWRYQSYPWTAIAKDPSLLWREAQKRGEADIRAFLESLVPKAEASTDVGQPQAPVAAEAKASS